MRTGSGLEMQVLSNEHVNTCTDNVDGNDPKIYAGASVPKHCNQAERFNCMSLGNHRLSAHLLVA